MVVRVGSTPAPGAKFKVMESNINVVTDRYDKALREQALKVLQKAKDQEAAKKKSGAKFISSGLKTWKLCKQQNNKNS